MAKAGEVTVSVNVECEEAIAGLKAIQREAREATKALRELENAREIDRLADFLLANYSHEIGRGDSVNGESAVDVAIRLLK